jgi:hypothetical protein
MQLRHCLPRLPSPRRPEMAKPQPRERLILQPPAPIDGTDRLQLVRVSPLRYPGLTHPW